MSNSVRESSPERRRVLMLAQFVERDSTSGRSGRAEGPSVGELSQLFSVSEVTVRKDLDLLEMQGLLTRVHGGAIVSGRGRLEVFFAARAQTNLEEKRRIAAAAAAMVESRQSIFLDASTTALQVARLIKDREDLTVVTNGLYTAQELTFATGVSVIVVGGIVRRRSSSLVGGLNGELLQRLRVDLGFFGAAGVSAADGLTEIDVNEAQLKHQMVRASARVIGIANSSKWGLVHVSAFALPDEIDVLISDTAVPEDIADAVRARDVDVRLV